MNFSGSKVIKLLILCVALLLGSNILVNCGQNGTAIEAQEQSGGEDNCDDPGKEPVNYNCSTQFCPNNMNICCAGYHCSNEYCRPNPTERTGLTGTNQKI